MKRTALVLAIAIAALGARAAITRAGDEKAPAPRDWKKLRADFPDDLKEPSSEVYKCEHPKLPDGWTPPRLEELEKMEWEPGRIVDTMELGRKRAAAIKPLCTEEEAVKLKNDSKENNEKIKSVMCRYPSSPDEVDWDATWNRFAGSPNTLNPLLSSSAYETYMNGLHGFGLFSFDHELKHLADPEVVKSWRRNKLIDLVEMRDDLTWDDGEPITTYDIEFSYHVIMDPKVPVPAQRSGTEELKWVKAYSPTVIAFFHKEPLVTNISNINFTVIPKHIYERSLSEDPTMRTSQWHAYWNRNPLSGGGYRLKEWKTGSHVTFERREEAYKNKAGKQVRTKPYFKYVRFRTIDEANAALLALKNGELDEMVLTARQWQMQTNDDDFSKVATKVRDVEWSYGQVIWNLKRPFFSDVRVRKALAYAFDSDELLKKIYFDLYEPCVGPFHPASPWGTPDAKPIKQDLDQAEKLLDEAGWKDEGKKGVRSKDGKPFEFTLIVPTGGTGPQVAEVLKQNLKDVGITMNIKLLEWATYLQSIQGEHNFDAGVSAWGTGVDPDSAKNIWTTEMYENGRNYGGYSNPKVDELFKRGQREFDFEKRRAIYQEINRLIYEDQPYLFINYRATFWAFSKQLRGYNFSPRGVFSYGPGSSSIWKVKAK